MSTVIKKISAIALITLILFSTSFNLISYGVTLAEFDDITITSTQNTETYGTSDPLDDTAYIENISVKGNNTKSEGIININKDTLMEIEVTVNTKSEVEDISIYVEDSMHEGALTIKDRTQNQIVYAKTITLPQTENTKSALADKGKITVKAYVSKGEAVDEKSKKVTITSTETNTSARISSVKFMQEGSKKSNIFDASDNQNKTAKLTVILSGVESISETKLEKQKIVVSSFKGFTQGNTTFKGKNGDNAEYEIDLKYSKLNSNDLINNSYVECEVKASIDGKLVSNADSKQQIEIKNVDTKKSSAALYYRQGTGAEVEFKEGATINLSGEDKISLIISIKNKDTSSYELTADNSQTTIKGKYDKEDNQTTYSMRFTTSADYTLRINGGILVTVKASITNTDAKYLYIFNSNGSGMSHVQNSSNVVTAKTDRQYQSSDIQGGTDNWLIKDTSSDAEYFCFDHSKGLRFESGTYYYEYKLDKNYSESNISKENQLVLAFIQNVSDKEAAKIAGTSLPKNWRENLLQYYIWDKVQDGKSQNVNYGVMKTFINKITASKNDYIDFKNGTLKLDGKEYKLTEFSASKYIVEQKLYSSTGSAHWVRNNNDLQPMFIFNCKIEEGPNTEIHIKLQKVDKSDKGLNGAGFTIYEYNEKTKEWKQYGKEIFTGNDGYIQNIKIEEDKKYKIVETTAPAGYKLAEEYVIVETINGETTYTVYNKENKEVSNSTYWDENELDEEVALVLSLTDIPEEETPPEIKIKIEKTNEKGEALEGAGFTISVYDEDAKYWKKYGEEVFTGSDGYIQNLKVEKDKKYRIVETTAPKGYKLAEEYVIVETKNGEISYKVYNEEKEITNSKYWEESELSEEIALILSLIDIPEEDKPQEIEIKIVKVNEEGKVLSGAGFTISKYNESTKTWEKYGEEVFTGSDGYIQNLKVEKDSKYRILETTAPKGYKLAEEYIIIDTTNNQITYKIYDKQDKELTQSKSWAKNGTNGDLKIELKLEDKPEETPPPPPPQPQTPVTPDSSEEELKLPLLMYIKGTVWLDELEGKNSEADGYLGDSDKKLEGILVELYDESGNLAQIASVEKLNEAISEKEVPTSITEHISKLKEQGEKNIVVTDKDGNFAFYGLDPAKKYTVKFTYNGMRYVEIKADTTSGISGYDISKNEASKAIENSEERNKMIETFKEIGTYPYNYNSENLGTWNIAYTQMDVEEALKNGLSSAGSYLELYGDSKYSNLDKYITDKNIAAFIKDTKITAEVKDLGNILESAEKAVKEKNKTLNNNANIDFIYPVVAESEKKEYNSLETAKQYAESMLKNNIVGYYINEYYCVNKYHKPTYDVQEKQVETNKETLANIYYNYKGKTGTNSMNITLSNYIMTQRGSYGYREELVNKKYEVILFVIKEGYTSLEENNIRFADFKLGKNEEPLYSQDTSKTGVYDSYFKLTTGFGWYNYSRSAIEIYKEMVATIDKINAEKELIHVNLGVLYRPTMDLGLYIDVTDAYLNINSMEEKYYYDKRAANGGIFKFGVNEYDIVNGTTNVEEQYKEYYKNLSNGEKTPNYTSITQGDDYLHLLKKEDIFPLELAGLTADGKAEAGGYNRYPIVIKLTYKVKIVNQSETESTVTELVDYYNKDFKVNGIYKDKEKTQSVKYSDTSKYNDRGNKKMPEGYNAVYIQMEEQWLKNNDSEYLYIELEMLDPRTTLNGKLEGEGYKAYNYIEINGYKTNIGVIDIDSIPGDIVEKPNEDGTSRFDLGIYEDDESKSPAMIFKYDNCSRTVSGTFFEDKVTSLGEEKKAYLNGQRNGNNLLDESDNKVVGGIVRLLEVDSNGNVITTSVDKGTGIRAQTQTDANGNYEFKGISAGFYKVEFEYGGNKETILIKGLHQEGKNAKSYNGQDFENVERTEKYEDNYWYVKGLETGARVSDAQDIESRRIKVAEYSKLLTNHIAEVFNSYKDTKCNDTLLNELITNTSMKAQTEKMALEIENYKLYPEKTVAEAYNRKPEDYVYVINNIDFGIVERERAEVQITKKVSKISLVDSTGKVITEGTWEDKDGNGLIDNTVDYVKWLKGSFVNLEIDKELLNGATLKVTYEIEVTNTSEAGNKIEDIKVVDYVSNNLNYDEKYGDNKDQKWTAVKVSDLEPKYVNSKIDLSTYQAILVSNFGTLNPGENSKKYITLEKNLSSQEESDFNFENQVEIISSKNENGRGDYSSIYGNLDPTTNTSYQGDLNWDRVKVAGGEHYFMQEETCSTDGVKQSEIAQELDSSIRLAEKDSGNAEKVIVSPPTGLTTNSFMTREYIMAITLMSTLVGIIALTKKYIFVK